MRAADQVRHLPWLAPSAPALAVLATAKQPWNDPVVCHDPGAVALLLRFNKSFQKPTLEITAAERADLLRFAIKKLRSRPRGVATQEQGLRAVRRISDLASRLAADDIAESVRLASLMTGLGQSFTSHRPIELTVRLARRWALPAWCVGTLAALDHSPDVAASLGADPRIVAVIRAAAWLVDPKFFHGLTSESIVEAGLDGAAARQIANELPIAAVNFENPYQTSLLPELLRASESNWRRDSGELLHSLEDEVERLHSTLAHRQQNEEKRLLNRKLTAIAEFAAGAGHEINTPLAIISGQAQLLLQNEIDADRRKSLDTIVQQSRRVHEILTDLMQFARPAKPLPQVFDLDVVIGELLESFRANTADRDIEIKFDRSGLIAHADSRQACTALSCLIRNAIEATPDQGWISVYAEEMEDQIQIIVDDSGPAPDASMIDHLFDPFFSGREAGRGRGLGLPTAWRLAREQGGDVSYERLQNGPTRFVMTLPKAQALPTPERMSA